MMASAKQHYVHPYLRQFLGQWVTVGRLNALMYFQDSQGNKSTPGYWIYKLRIVGKRGGRARNGMLRRLFKAGEVIARARVHHVTAHPNETLQRCPECNAIHSTLETLRLNEQEKYNGLALLYRKAEQTIEELTKKNDKLNKAVNSTEINKKEQLHWLSLIMLKTTPIMKTGGVYFMITNNEIVYVGKSKNVESRTAGRANIAEKCVMVVVDDDVERSQIEAQLIKLLNPRGNTRLANHSLTLSEEMK